MKRVNLTGYGLAAALMLLASACDEGFDNSRGTGTITPLVDYDPTVISARSVKSRAAEIGDITPADLTLTLTSDDGSLSETFLAGSFPTDRGFAIGKYAITAAYGDPEQEGFECPAVYGEAELSVNEGKATQVILTAVPSKAMVTVKFTPELTDYMTSCSARLHTPGGEYIDYSTSETRPVYLKPGNVSLSVTFEKPNGMGGTLEVSNFTAEARTHYTVTLGLGGDGVGSAMLSVNYDETLEAEEVLVDISDKVLSTPAPVVTPSGFNNDQLFSTVEGSPLSVAPRFNIMARGGIDKVTLTTSCPGLIDKGWPAEVDLAAASPTLQAAMTSLGMKDLGVFRNPGQMAAVDLSGVIANIPATSAAASPAKFTLVVTDKAGKSSEPVGFQVKVDKLELRVELQNPGLVYRGEGSVKLLVKYNGSQAIQDAVNITYKNTKGMPAKASVAYSPVSRAALPEYVATVTIPDDAGMPPLTLVAECGSLPKVELEIAAEPVLSVNANDVFATRLVATAKPAGFDFKGKNAALYVSTDNSNFAPLSTSFNGATLTATGLTPGTKQYVRIQAGNIVSNTVEITTEAASQIANGNLNDGWSSTNRKAGLTTFTPFWSAPSPWDTNNEVGFSETIVTCSLSAVSAVSSTDDSRSGKAAIIRTSGYHQTTATMWSYPDKFYAGELYLGTISGTTPQYGVDFTSRPSEVTFWYKYQGYAAQDRGVAEAKVVDASGNVIASGSLLIENKSSYTKATIPLSYNKGAAKAAKIQINFKSTNQAVGESSVNRVANDYNYGAAFYVDDVELVY